MSPKILAEKSPKRPKFSTPFHTKKELQITLQVTSSHRNLAKKIGLSKPLLYPFSSIHYLRRSSLCLGHLYPYLSMRKGKRVDPSRGILITTMDNTDGATCHYRLDRVHMFLTKIEFH